ELHDLDIDVVIGPRTNVDSALIAEAEALPNVTVHRAPSQERLAELMNAADLALGAGGVMLWERLCLGLPSLVVQVADNQRPQIDSMSDAGAIRFIGAHTDVTPAAIAEAVIALAADEHGRGNLSDFGRKLVDGRGAI